MFGGGKIITPCHYIYILVSEVTLLRQLLDFGKVLGTFFRFSRCIKKNIQELKSDIRTQNQ